MPLSAGKIRTMVEPHSVSAGRETPSRTAMDSHSRTCSLAVAQLRHVHSTSSAGRGSCQQPNIDRDGMPARNHEAHYVRSEVSRVHRGPRTERREFASLEPLKDEEQNSLSCDAVTSSSRTRGVGLEEVTVEWNRGGLEGRCSCPLSDGSCWKIKGSKRTARRLLFSRSAVELLPEGHGASLELVSLAPLTTARVLQALQHPSKTPGVRLPQRVGRVVHAVSLAAKLLGPGPACRGGVEVASVEEAFFHGE